MGSTAEQDQRWLEEEEEEDLEALKCNRKSPAAPEPEEEEEEAPLAGEELQGGGGPALQLESERSVYLDTQDGTWKCHHCAWTYQMGISGINDPIQKPKDHHGLMDLETIVHNGTCFSLETKGTESTNGTGGVKYGVLGEKQLGNGASDFTPNAVDIPEILTNETNYKVHKNLKDEGKSGTESTNGTDGVKYGVLDEKKLGNGASDFTTNAVDIPEILTNETDYKIPKNLQDEGQSGLHLLQIERSSETTSHRPVPDPHLRVLKESKEAEAELDVERILAKQETHDLYCPNCNSCITKRVILRKRKRIIQNPQNNLKREKKIEVVQSSSVATSSQGHDTTLPGFGGSPPSVDTDDQDNVTQPDLFRCLSCFSFFIPSVAIFKSFRLFGDKNERGSAQNLQQIPVAPGAVKQGEDNSMLQAEEVVIEEFISQHPLNHQTGQVSSVIHMPNSSPKHTVNGAVLEPQEDRKDFSVSSTTTVRLEIVKNGVQDISNGSVIMQREDEKNATFSSIPEKNSLPVDSHVNEQVNVSTMKVWNDEQNGQASSVSVSIHLVDTRTDINTDINDKHNDSGKRIEGGYDVMHDQCADNLVNPLLYLDKYTEYEKNAKIPGPLHPGISNTMLAEDPELIHLKEGNAISRQEALLFPDKRVGIGKDLESLPMSPRAGKDVILEIKAEQVRPEVFPSVQNNIDSSTPGSLKFSDIEYQGYQQVGETRTSNEWDVLKSIVYGGLVQSITSLGVVSSAAGGGATTLNIIALGLANLVGGLFVIAHGLMDLKDEQHGGTTNHIEIVDRYQELLGKRTRFRLHAIIVVLSFILFGLVAPVTYSFSFRKSDNTEYKLIAVAVASLLCITLLAFAKAHVRKPPKGYLKTALYYFVIGVMSAGLSYVAGVLIKKLLERLGWFDSTIIDPVPPPSDFLEQMAMKSSWASY